MLAETATPTLWKFRFVSKPFMYEFVHEFFPKAYSCVAREVLPGQIPHLSEENFLRGTTELTDDSWDFLYECYMDEVHIFIDDLPEDHNEWTEKQADDADNAFGDDLEISEAYLTMDIHQVLDYFQMSYTVARYCDDRRKFVHELHHSPLKGVW